ncbi:MAG TPA: sugar ABC transporter ATP-binding protein [Candidatus Hydrogenedentes bacterium]|nr:sugar ABC transporter ATP-binding protein [Candidatus Hydrogenedentota bacterium]HOV73556.1 sugar ABC transporter ATP-binding protein [Candidatus Hydrogenedentota bacterium]HPC16546.1 sugar ABC transporter ATP-binding protein [Candidatus Hydrogenedentota bacterium]HRT18955.1 sugar ABC transporter ATP-binding protein [Candidatus Hydrogenedentota bacterium]HRT64933.1 sugar ABC transporter ATP-binding protein [Candidatus Hydrogenedentota bacterium]
MEGVSKRFPGTLAVDNVSMEVRAGEIHALMGENGAGKSTLMKILAGAFNDYTGAIRVGGQEVRLESPMAAKRHGIGMVFQELSLARPISIAENLLAGRMPVTRWGMLDRRRMLDEARRCLELVGLDINPLKTVEEISQHEAQQVEIAKVLGNAPCILILDEPTSALSREEVHRLFAILRDLRRGGLAIVYISHHLPEVFEIADRVTVLRDGRKIATRDIADTTPQALVQMMVGQTIERFYSRRETAWGGSALRVEHLTRHGFFHDVSFEVRKGEILGLAGLSGAGRTELARSLCGLDPLDHGVVNVCGEEFAGDYPQAVAKGLVYLTEDRKVDGLFLRLSVEKNLLAALLPFHSKAGIYRSGRDIFVTRKYLEELEVVAASAETDAGTLSGGNQQKVLLGKWLATNPRVLILDEPTRGVDVKAKRKIHESLLAIANRGAAMVLISSDLPELAGLSDRVLVMRRGRLIGEMHKEDLSEEALLLAMNGHEAPAGRSP